MKPVKDMAEHEILQEIRYLNDPEGYFGAIVSFSHQNNITQEAAWEKIEKRREELGIGTKYSNYGSYRANKCKFQQNGGMFRLNAED